MEEKVVGALATLLKQDAEVVTESLKTDEGVEGLVSSITSLKTFNDEEFGSLKDNIRKDVKDDVYNEVKGTTMEMVEKNIKKQHSLEWKRGEDYDDLLGLVAKIQSTASEQKGDVNEKLEADFKELQNKYNSKESEHEEKLKTLMGKHDSEIANVYLNAELAKIRPNLDIDEGLLEGQLDMFKVVFNQKYNVLRNDEGLMVVSDKEGNILKNEDVSPKSLSDVVSEVSKSHLKYKEVVPKEGRGKGEPSKNKPLNSGNKYSTYEEFLASKDGEGLHMGSLEAVQKYQEFRA